MLLLLNFDLLFRLYVLTSLHNIFLVENLVIYIVLLLSLKEILPQKLLHRFVLLDHLDLQFSTRHFLK